MANMRLIVLSLDGVDDKVLSDAITSVAEKLVGARAPEIPGEDPSARLLPQAPEAPTAAAPAPTGPAATIVPDEPAPERGESVPAAPAPAARKPHPWRKPRDPEPGRTRTRSDATMVCREGHVDERITIEHLGRIVGRHPSGVRTALKKAEADGLHWATCADVRFRRVTAADPAEPDGPIAINPNVAGRSAHVHYGERPTPAGTAAGMERE